MNQDVNTAQPAHAAAAAAVPEQVEVEDLDTFVKILTRWHTRKVAVLEHFLKLEGGIEMQVGDDPSFKLEGDTLAGMKAGIQLALMEFGVLPFAVEFEAAADNAPPTAQAQVQSGG